MTDCLFCKIAAKELPADVLHESDSVLAFRDINPGAPTHVLVIPKEHVSSASDLSASHADLLAEIFVVIKDLAEREGVADGHRIVTNVGVGAGQTVLHLHFHLLGGRSLAWPPG